MRIFACVQRLQPDLFSNVPDDYLHANELEGESCSAFLSAFYGQVLVISVSDIFKSRNCQFAVTSIKHKSEHFLDVLEFACTYG